MRIPFQERRISNLAERYLDIDYAGVPNRVADERTERTYSAARQRGHMTRDDLWQTAKWHYPRKFLLDMADQKAPDKVEQLTRESFAAVTDRERVEPLIDLHGFSWSMASVIPHFVFPASVTR